MAEYTKHALRLVAPDYKIPRGAVTYENGLTVPKVAVATFDPSANASERTVAAHGLGVYIPDNAIITKVWYDVITTFASPTSDAATIALHVQGANDIVTALAISGSGDIWDAGIHGSKIGFPALADTGTETAVAVAALFSASYLKMTAEREIIATIAVEAVTAGKLVVFAEYLISA